MYRKNFSRLACIAALGIIIVFKNYVVVIGQTPALATPAVAASPITPEMRKAANDAYQRSDWAAATADYEKILAAEAANVGARYRYGLSLLNLGNVDAARTNLEKAFDASPNSIFALALARAYARSGNTDKAYETLEKSLTLGGIAPETLKAEKDLASFAGQPRFAELVRKSDLAVNPCKASPEFRQFDFWIGEWDAKNAQGLNVGTSSIQLILGSCVIFENWNTPLNSGKSFSIYDAKDKRWHQSWVDDKGTRTEYIGDVVDGKIVLTAETSTGGKKTLAKMTYSRLPNGDVRQFGESSSDNGKTWQPSFDFTYVKRT